MVEEFENTLEHRLDALEAAGGGSIEWNAVEVDGRIHLTASSDILLDGAGSGVSLFGKDGEASINVGLGGGSIDIVAEADGAVLTLSAPDTNGQVRIIAETVKVGGSAAAVGFYGATPVAKQTGVAVTPEAIHAALVALGLIAGP